LIIIPQTQNSVKEGILNHIPTVLFVCSGNYCRSPMAEALARKHLRLAGYDSRIAACSAGTRDVYAGQPPAPLVVEVLRERDSDGPTRHPHLITSDEIAQADLILGVAGEHVEWLAQNYPEAAARTYLLTDLIGEAWDMIDPGVQALDPLRQCAGTIEQVITSGLSEMIQRVQSTSKANR
jgi:protein-tyrosine-phosphatase